MASDESLPLSSDHTGWSDSSARAVLQLMVESVAELIGFEIAALSVVLDGDLVTVAYTGPEEHREYLMNAVDPVEVLDPVLERAESWGRFRFLDADLHQIELEGHWVLLAPDQAAHRDSWHPENVLIGVLSDDDGRMIGVLSVDVPVSGRCPDAAQRDLLERYAAQAERAVLTAFEREELVRQVEHAESARRLIRSAAMPAQASLEAVLVHTNGPLLEGFDAGGLWVEVFDGGDRHRGYARNRDDEIIVVPDEIVALARRVAPELWEQQQVLVLGDGAELGPPGLDPGLIDESIEQIKVMELDRVLAAPVGAGSECLGLLVLTRNVKDQPWTAVEAASALEIGHDLGAAFLTAQALERERALVRELQELDDYRSQLFATLSHELRTPLTVIAGNLELVGGLVVDERAVGFLAAMSRGADRMQKVVDDLMLLARVSHPRHPLADLPIDLREVALDVITLLDSTASSKGLELDVHLDDGPLLVPGDRTEIDQLIGNLVSNAVKYTSVGGTVTLSIRRRGAEVEIQVADDGLGIAEADQARIFRAFYRTENPAALNEPGTGLGLAIVATVVERHGGRVEVDSRLGDGTTFTVTLPAMLAG